MFTRTTFARFSAAVRGGASMWAYLSVRCTQTGCMEDENPGTPDDSVLHARGGGTTAP